MCTRDSLKRRRLRDIPSVDEEEEDEFLVRMDPRGEVSRLDECSVD